MIAPILKTSDLCRSFEFGDQVVHALRGVSVEVPTGQFVAVIGKSGSGKSTFINIMGCLDRPTSGTYRLDGSDGVGLAARADRHPSQLSGGDQQRVAIARALVNRPRLLLADEPTGNLDTNTSLEIMQIIEQLNREQQITVVLVTHEPDIAAYADRVLTFRDGQIVVDVMQRPASPIPVRPSQDAIFADTFDLLRVLLPVSKSYLTS
jgi:ABC-type lipoprotein export system ATPase subunit